LIELVLTLKGPSYLCDEIARDESDEYTGAALKWALLSYVSENKFDKARILDFGCGAGASSIALCRMFPSADVVGFELEEKALEVARARADFYELSKLRFVLSPSGTELPPKIGQFDYIVMSGVFEHLLPDERVSLLPKLWEALKANGILFLRETPHRYFPIETHTTGLPLLNYLPSTLALTVVRRFSGRHTQKVTWNDLLRQGIRGGTIYEIRNLLSGANVLKPSRLGIKDLVDLWYATTPKSKRGTEKKYVYRFAKALKAVGLEWPPYLELALQKQS